MLPSVNSYPVVSDAGAFTGNSTANRAIPHKLARVPDLILLQGEAAGYGAVIIVDGYVSFSNSGADAYLSVTAADATNFYVGNITNYATSGNDAKVWNWVAI